MDILTLILAMRMSGGGGGSGSCDCNAACAEDLTKLLIEHSVLPAWTDEDGNVLVDENLKILI